MNFLQSFIGNQGASGLPYIIGDEDTSFYAGAETGWKLYSAVKKDDKSEVSLFKFLKKEEKNKRFLDQATFRRTKTLRHPHTLLYLDGVDLPGETVIVTEKVVTLEYWLREVLQKMESQKQKNMAISWGLHCILKALAFLNNDCKLIHGNISLDSIFVTVGGDWKLGGLYIVGEVDTIERAPCRLFREHSNILANKYKPPERQKNQWNAVARSVHGSDIWALGCVMFECFNGIATDSNEFMQTSRIPSFLRKLYTQMLSSNPEDRPDAEKLYKSQGFQRAFKNRFFACNLFLEEIQLKSIGEKLDFFQRISSELDSFPPQACKYKILKEIKSTQEGVKGQNLAPQAQGQLATVLFEPVLKIGSMFEDDEAEYKKHVVPAIINLFACNDRGIRVSLLQNLDRYAKFLDEQVMNGKLFESICSGFGDTTPILRELTLKSMLVIAPKLSEKNLNDVLMRHLVRLQSDQEPSIRTNTVICLSRIVQYTNEATREKLIIGSFPKAAREHFTHTRIAGLKAIASTYKHLLTAPKVPLLTAKVLPAICVALSDASPEVRSIAFATMKTVLKDLEAESEERAIAQAKEPAKEGSATQNGASQSDAANQASSTSAMFNKAAGWAASSIWKRSNSQDEKVKQPTPTPTPVNQPPTIAALSLNQKAGSKVEEANPHVTNGWDNDDDFDDDFHNENDDNDSFGDDSFGDSFEERFKATKKSPVKKLNVPKSGGMKLSAEKKSSEVAKSERRKAIEKKRVEARQRRSNRGGAKKVSASELAKSALQEDDFFNSF
eukprot:CAMPEP_0184019906 /NCGR_PEP_ID=MMETSP0954-20121128/9033_1 /TAXON_ID=627963 /ORGANISM="Aplanochytrium sp, Strain PBS07" /LENGTH=780 /DNA_ID=CAMNT_0026301667 /DNA_START=217 /DNA_END=2559 /DNA_ORIENTATION=+